MRNRDVYNSDYFNFTLSLASVNAVCVRVSFFLYYLSADCGVVLCYDITVQTTPKH